MTLKEALQKDMKKSHPVDVRVIIRQALRKRLESCEDALVKLLRGRDYSITRDGVESKNGLVRFSPSAHKTILEAIEKVNDNNLNFTKEELIQITKAVCETGCQHWQANVIVDELITSLLKEGSK